tara:strand:- start:581 stop:937 length:357 start_codon:yes stop_codon:yes gene_type:complete
MIQSYTINVMEKWQLKAKRKFRQKGITLDQVGEKLGGLKKSAMSLKLNAHCACDDQEMILIANMLDMTLDELVSDDPIYRSDAPRKQEAARKFYNSYQDLSDDQKIMILQLMETMTDE